MPGFLTTIARALRWHRRLVAAACAAVAVYAILTVLTAPEGDVRVVAAARGIAGGSVLEAADVTTVLLPAGAVPEGAARAPADVVGETLVAPVPARGVLTASDLVSGGAVVGTGRVALPVAFDASAPVGVLRIGDTIDLLGVGESGAGQVVVEKVRVAALPQAAGGGPFGGGGEPVVLVDLSPEQAAAVTSAARRSPLAFALR